MVQKKRRSPKEVIESEKDPLVEHVYIKFPGKELISLDKVSDENQVLVDAEKYYKLIDKYGEKALLLHTHPGEEPSLDLQSPAAQDFKMFMKNKEIKTMVVAQTNEKTGELGSYFTVKKNKRHFQKPKSLFGKIMRSIENFLDPLENAVNLSSYDLLIQDYAKEPEGERRDEYLREGLDKLTEGLNLKYRLTNFNTRKTKLKVASIIGIGSLALSLLFFSPTLTGNAIANLTTKTSSLIGAGLFIVGIVGSYFWFKRK